MKHFVLDEFLQSATARKHNVDMTPTPKALSNLNALVDNVLDPLRERLGRPVYVSSGYRPRKLNALVGGAQTSQHCYGQAADIRVDGMSVHKLCEFIITEGLPFDQLIDEYGRWVHVSYGPRNRREVLTARKNSDGRTIYSRGLTA